MTVDISKNNKLAIIEQQLAVWKNTQYNEIINLKVAEKIGDEGMENTARDSIKRCEIALDVLAEELKGLEGAE